MPKPPVTWEAGDNDWLVTGQGGLGVIGQLLATTSLGSQLNASCVPEAKQPEISHRDVAFSFIGLLAQGQPDYDAIEAFRADPFFALALSLEQVPSSPTLRQRLDQAAVGEDIAQWSQIFQDTTVSLLTQHIHCEPIRIGSDPASAYVPLDLDVSPFDNGKTKKEGVSRTYKGCDGYAPIFSYLGHEGYALGAELREGKQHSQKNTPAFLRQSLQRAHQILPEAHLLVRMDSGNDAWDNMVVCRAEHADFLIKHNLRRESLDAWVTLARQEGHRTELRKGKAVYHGSTMRSPQAGRDPERVIYEVIERTSTVTGQVLLFPDIEVATYWTSLPHDPVDILPWYPDHGTMEQYHSEYKTDMNLERLPSGKFATNALILQIALLVFNLLRIMGQATLDHPQVPLRRPVVRRRLRTVIQNLVLCAAQLIRHARRVWARYARHNPWGHVLGYLYALWT